ncbi:hypothetical protein pipiens_003069 [Culex pipiens pipiens]|uniref:Methyltransferase n=1 Tax=Culex pipiens pipiens TaxID=38569 RepID=A0ABD1D423_CULPP
MMTSDWDKIMRLASDFQNAQLTTSFQRLSELRRSGHEKGLLEVIYTIDGKGLSINHVDTFLGISTPPPFVDNCPYKKNLFCMERGQSLTPPPLKCPRGLWMVPKVRDEMFVRGGRINLVDLANVQ